MPDYEAFMLPLLEAVAPGPLPLEAVATQVADKLALPEADRAARPVWSHEPLMIARTRVAAESLAAAQLIERTDGALRLADRGQALLSEQPTALTREALRRYPEFETYLQDYLARQGA